MAATALLKFSQGALIGADGQALLVVTGQPVTIENADNTDIGSWRLDLWYTPPGSSVAVATPLASNASGSVPTDVITPDVPGCYRIQLTVWEGASFSGEFDIDIRNVGVPEPKHGFIRPPYQGWPQPLPLPQSSDPAAKPDELNFGGQTYGWHGVGGDNLLHDVLGKLDRSEFDALPEVASGLVGEVPTISDAQWREPFVIVSDGTYLWVAGGDLITANSLGTPRGSVLHKVDPATGAAVASFYYEDEGSNGLLTDSALIGCTVLGTDVWLCGVDSDGDGILVRFDTLTETFTTEANLGATVGPYSITNDGTNLWITDAVGGEVHRIIPSAPTVLDATVAVTAPFLVHADLDGANYVDTNPRIYVVGTDGVYRINAVGTPAIENSHAVFNVNGLWVGGGSVWWVTDTTVENRSVTFAFINSLTISALFTGFVKSVIYDEVNDKVFVLGTESDGDLLLARYSTVPALESSVILSSAQNASLSTIELSLQMVTQGSQVFVPDPEFASSSFNDSGPGSVYRVNLTGALAATEVLRNTRLLYETELFTIQTLTGVSDDETWDTTSSAIAVDGSGARTIRLPTVFTQKRIHIFDRQGNAGAGNIVITQLGGGTISGNASYTISSNYGSVTLARVSDTSYDWTIVAQDPVTTAVDSDAVHVDVAGEIAAVNQKATPVSGDWILIEDSAAANVKKRVSVGDLIASAATLSSVLAAGNTTGGTAGSHSIRFSTNDNIVVLGEAWDFTIAFSAGATTANGGGITARGQNGHTSFDGGDVGLFAGASNAATGNFAGGASINLEGGQHNGADPIGGSAVIEGGAANGTPTTRTAGGVELRTGVLVAGGTTRTAGNIILDVTNANATTGATGVVRLSQDTAPFFTFDPASLAYGPTTLLEFAAVSTNYAIRVADQPNAGGGSLLIVGSSSTQDPNGGQAIVVQAGNGFNTGTGGWVTVQAGRGGDTGSAGTAQLIGGAGGAASGAGGPAYVLGGTPTSGAGGSAHLVGADGVGAAGGGIATVSGGAGGATSGAGGSVAVTAGNAIAGVSNGGGLTLSAGLATTTGVDGSLNLRLQNTSGSATKGTINFQQNTTTYLQWSTAIPSFGIGFQAIGEGTPMTLIAGPGNITTGGVARLIGGSGTGAFGGGDAYLSGGTAFGSGIGGYVNITAGGTATGTAGSIIIQTTNVTTSGSGGNITLALNHATASGKGQIFLDQDGQTYFRINPSSGVLFQVDDNAGAFTLTQQNAASAAGSTMSFIAQQGGGANVGGALNVTAGRGGPTGIGGALNLTAGAGGASSGGGGAVNITAGSPTSGAGGSVNIASAAGVFTFNAGSVWVTAAAGGATSGDDGKIWLDLTTGGGGATGVINFSKNTTPFLTWDPSASVTAIFAAEIGNVTFGQTARTTAGTDGFDFTIYAQDGNSTASANGFGGDMIVRAGSGDFSSFAPKHGNMRVQGRPGTQELDDTWTGNIKFDIVDVTGGTVNTFVEIVAPRDGNGDYSGLNGRMQLWEDIFLDFYRDTTGDAFISLNQEALFWTRTDGGGTVRSINLAPVASVSPTNFNISFFDTISGGFTDLQDMTKGVYWGNGGTVPTADPTDGMFLWVSGGTDLNLRGVTNATINWAAGTATLSRTGTDFLTYDGTTTTVGNTGSGTAFTATTTDLEMEVNLLWVETPTNPPVITQVGETTGTSTAALFTIAAQDHDATTGTNVAGAMLVRAGDTSGAATQHTAGKMTVRAGNAAGATTNIGGDLALLWGTGAQQDGNITLGADNTAWQSGEGIFFMGNMTTAPTGNPTSGIYVYIDAGAGKARGTSGTITTWAPAEPHCGRCGRDSAHEWENPKHGWKLSICAWCLTDGFDPTKLVADGGCIIEKYQKAA